MGGTVRSIMGLIQVVSNNVQMVCQRYNGHAIRRNDI